MATSDTQFSYHTCINFCVFEWQENSWGINFCGHGGLVGTIVVGFAKYASYCGLLFVVRGIPQNPQKFMHLENLYAYGMFAMSIT